MAALPVNNAPPSSSSPKKVISGIFTVTHTVDASASSTAGPSTPVLPKLSLSAPRASQSYPDSPSPSPSLINDRVASRTAHRPTSTETQRTISTSARPPTRITSNGTVSSSRSRPSPALPRYEQAPPPGLSEKQAIPFGAPVPKARPPLSNGFSCASSSSTSSSPSSSWNIDEKAGALPPSLIDVSEDPLRRCTMNNAKHFSSVPMRSASSCPLPCANSHCPSTSTTMDAAHRSSLIAHQRHYGHRVKPPCCLRFTIPPAIKPWLPMCTWFATTIGLIIAVAFWRTEVFTGLDDLSAYMKQEGYYGQAILFSLILLTTFPPLPLYSTLMMLAGYTFGPATAFFISYFASLLGALVVFLIFRHFVPSRVAQGLLPPSLKRVVRAIEQRPSIFLLIRVAPYPYNVLNAVLGSSSNMGIGTYMGTTAISLLKVIVHTSLGSEIRSFKDLHATNKAASSGNDAGKNREITWGEIWTGIGIVLCVGLFVYLSIVARRAVNEECEHDGYEPLPTTLVPPSPLAPPVHAPPQMRTLDGQPETTHASFNPFNPFMNSNGNSGSHAQPHSHPDKGELRNAPHPRSPQEMGEFALPPSSSYSPRHTPPRPLSA